MKISPRTLLAAALLTALPMGGALACTTVAWDATTNAQAGNPKGRNGEPAVPRYSGTCGLEAATAGASYVTDNTGGGGEAIYRARFYVYTGSAADGTQIFSATSGADGGGSPAFSIAIDNGALAFTVNNTTVAGTHPIVASKWYGVEVLYRANGAFTAKVRGNRALTESTYTSAGNAGAVNVGSARLGVINAVSNATSLAFDAFESTRSEATEIGRLCPGDANGNNIVNSGDAIVVLNEVPANGAYAQGQPDCTEDGLINAGDAICVLNRFAVPAQRDCIAI
ncbi:hypothetical protein OS187_10355 [Xanthomonadaceae bacterium JHOS43]|nr:hypothetical protein [Xanthomonadaceae bacterium JHOS43]